MSVISQDFFDLLANDYFAAFLPHFTFTFVYNLLYIEKTFQLNVSY